MLLTRLALAGVLLAGCGSTPPPAARTAPWEPEPRPELGAVVARVGGVPIHAAEVAAQARRQRVPPRQALDTLVAFHLLAERARGAWPPSDPDAPRVRKEILVQRLVERELEPALAKEALGDAELRAAYDRVRDRYVHPRLVEVAVLNVVPGRGAKREARQAARELMQKVAQEVARRPSRAPEDFPALVAENQPWRAAGLRASQIIQGMDKPWSATFGAAVQKLKAPGDTTPLFEDEYGFYIARFIREEPARNVPFEAAREELREQLYPAWRDRRFLELSAALAARHEVQVLPEALLRTTPQAP